MARSYGRVHAVRYLISALLFLVWPFGCGGAVDQSQDSGVARDGALADSARDVAITNSPSELVNEINAYRVSRGLVPVPFSPSLQIVAEKHVADLVANYVSGTECNLHSWSEGSSEWGGCCYTSDHARAQCMWDKPKELTSYPGSGYEVSAAGAASAAGAVMVWKASSAHHAVLINEGIWEKEWKALGGANAGSYWVAWFGHESDPAR